MARLQERLQDEGIKGILGQERTPLRQEPGAGRGNLPEKTRHHPRIFPARLVGAGIRLRHGLDGHENAAHISHKATDDERAHPDLEDDFDTRSFITYKDNEMVEGKLLTFDIPLARATLTTIAFGPQTAGFSLLHENGQLSLVREADGASETLLSFSLPTVALG